MYKEASSQSSELKLVFYDGRKKNMENQEMMEFEYNSILNRYYNGDETNSAELLQDLGPFALDFTDINAFWADQTPDIHPKSARLFTLWGKNVENDEVVVVIKGHYILVPYEFNFGNLKTFYIGGEKDPYFPFAIITTFRVSKLYKSEMETVVEQSMDAINENWSKLRQHLIDTLDPESDAWERFVYSIEKLIHFTFLCPSIDLELIGVLKKKGYQITGVMQLLASTTEFHDEATLKLHIERAKQVVDKRQSEIQNDHTGSD